MAIYLETKRGRRFRRTPPVHHRRNGPAMPLNLTPKQFSRFWSKVDRSGEEESCWIWIGHRSRGGYGSFSLKSRELAAHRVSWEIANGVIPDGKNVCHNCPEGDNPLCINPSHLWIGTQRQNILDMEAKGRARHLSRSQNGRAVLSEEDVASILDRLSTGEPQLYLAREYGVSKSTVWWIAHGKTWRVRP